MERLTGVGHDVRVERRRHRESDGRKTLLLQALLCSIDRLDGTGDHDLTGRVVVGHHNARKPIDQLRDRLGIRGHGQHGARPTRCGLGHELSSPAGGRQEIGPLQAAGSRQRGELTEAVSRRGIRAQAELVEQPRKPRLTAAIAG